MSELEARKARLEARLLNKLIRDPLGGMPPGIVTKVLTYAEYAGRSGASYDAEDRLILRIRSADGGGRVEWEDRYDWEVYGEEPQ